MKKLVVVVVSVVSVLAATATYAGPEPQGTWACYVADRFPDIEAARKWKGSRDVEAGMNQVAPHARSGAIVTVYMNGSPVICTEN